MPLDALFIVSADHGAHSAGQDYRERRSVVLGVEKFPEIPDGPGNTVKDNIDVDEEKNGSPEELKGMCAGLEINI